VKPFRVALVLSLSWGLAFASSTGSRADGTASAEAVAQGKYLVTRVSLCIDCHGAKLGGKPFRGTGPPHVPWATYAPKIAGLAMFAADADAVRFFETGVDAHGKHARRPMPQYRMHSDDAAAVVAYLRTLRP